MATPPKSPFNPAELEQVSLWAQVALAARGCRRLLPLLEVPRNWPSERQKLVREAAWHATGVSLSLSASAGGLSPSPTGVRFIFAALHPLTEQGNALASAFFQVLDAADRAANVPSEGHTEVLDALHEGMRALLAVEELHGAAAFQEDLRLVLSEGYGRGAGAVDGRFLAWPLWRTDHFDLKEPVTWLSAWERECLEEGLGEQAHQLRREWVEGGAFDPKLAYDQFELWWQHEQAREVIQQVGEPAVKGAARNQPDLPNAPEMPSSPEQISQPEIALETPSAQKPARPVRPLLRMLADEPLQDDSGDRLDFATYAEAVAGLIDNRTTKTPFTIAINAPWGAGKSTLANMIRKRLEENPADGGEYPHVTCTFNAWLHDDAPNLASAFAAEVARTANRARPWWRRLFVPLPMGLASSEEKRNHRLLTGFVTVASTFVLWWAMDRWWPGGIKWLTDAAGSLAGEGAKEAKALGGGGLLVFVAQQLLKRLGSMGLSLEDFVKKPEAAAGSGSMDQVRSQLGHLITQATPKGSRFVIFIDDLERCKPPRAVDVLEVVNQLLGHPGVVTVILADMPSVAAAANMKYKDIAEQEQKTGASIGPGGYGRNYLQKIIQLQFDLPAHSPLAVSKLAQDLARERGSADPETEPTEARGPLGRLRERLLDEQSLIGQIRSMVHASGLRTTKEPWSNRIGALIGILVASPLIVAMQTVFSKAYPDKARQELIAASFRASKRFGADIAYGLLGAIFGLIYLVFVIWIAGGLLLLLFGYPAMLARFPSWFGFPLSPPYSNLLSLVSVFLLTIGSILALLAFLMRHNFRMDRAATQKMADRVDKIAQEVGPNPDQIKEKLPEEERVRFDIDALIRRRVLRHTLSDDDLLDQATQDVFDYLPPMPRHAKRLVNQVRLLLSIARERGLFEAGVEPRHIGRWVTLRERWPEVAQRILSEHETMSELEDTARASNTAPFWTLIGRIAPSAKDNAELLRFCAAEPSLGPIAWQLVYLEKRPLSEPNATPV